MIAHSIREGFPYYLARATVLRGWALADQEQAEAGIAEIREGLERFRAMGMEHWVPCCLGLLAEAYGKAQKTAEGLAVLSEALEIAGRNGEREYEAELHRQKGELALQQPSRLNHATAEECFLRAIAVARSQDARSFELRASVSLARLWQLQDRTAEAHRMLAEKVRWFTEGFDTQDLRVAKTLLLELMTS